MTRRNMPSRRQIAAYWIGRHEKIQDESDADYCFACGDHYRVERAHITPRTDGGADTVENLHILCASCHIESEFLTGESYWHWFDQKPYRPHLWYVAERVSRMPYEAVCAICPISRDEFDAFVSKVRGGDDLAAPTINRR